MDQIVHYTNKSVSDYYPKEEQLILRKPDGTKRIVPETNITYLTGNSPGYVDMLVTLQNANRGLGVEEGQYKSLRLIKLYPHAKIYTEVWKDENKYFYLDPRDTPENGRLPRNWIDEENMNMKPTIIYYENIKFELYSTLPQFVENRSENEFLLTPEVSSLKEQLAQHQKKVNHLEFQVNQTVEIVKNLFPPCNPGKEGGVSNSTRVESRSSFQEEETNSYSNQNQNRRFISFQKPRSKPRVYNQEIYTARLPRPPFNNEEQDSNIEEQDSNLEILPVQSNNGPDSKESSDSVVLHQQLQLQDVVTSSDDEEEEEEEEGEQQLHHQQLEDNYPRMYHRLHQSPELERIDDGISSVTSGEQLQLQLREENVVTPDLESGSVAVLLPDLEKLTNLNKPFSNRN
jgi:hypothetical protein